MAYDYYKFYLSYADSVFNENRMKQINALETKYEAEKKEAELLDKKQQTALLKAKTALEKKWIYFFILGLVVLGLVGSMAFYNLWQKAKRRRLVQRTNEEYFDNEMSLLQIKEKEYRRKAVIPQLGIEPA